MTTLCNIGSRHAELIRQSDALFSKANTLPPSQRMTLESEVNDLEFSLMKLAKLIRKDLTLQKNCQSLINLDKLQGRITKINQLIYEMPNEEPATRVALNAFACGVVGGAISGIVKKNWIDSSQADAADEKSSLAQQEELVIMHARNLKVADITQQKNKVSEAQEILRQAEQVKNQAQKNTSTAYIELLNGVDISLFPPDITLNAGNTVSAVPQLILTKQREGELNTSYNEALANFAKESANLAKMERDYIRQNPNEDRGYLRILWDGTKIAFGFVFNIFSASY